jgi:hypothetical protein
MDWPLSRDEKKRQLLHLYDQDAQISEGLLTSNEAALVQLRRELEAAKAISGPCSKTSSDVPEDMKRLWQVVDTAAAVLRAVLPMQVADSNNDDEEPRMEARARSQPSISCGSLQHKLQDPVRAPLSRTPRTSRAGTPRRRVSFGAGPDDEERQEVEPEPEEASCISYDEAALVKRQDSPERRELQVPSVLHWGLTEFHVPEGVTKIGLHFLDLPPEPLLVRRVTADSWAELQGIRVGDTVIEIDGRRADALRANQFIRCMQCRPLRLIVERIPAMTHAP